MAITTSGADTTESKANDGDGNTGDFSPSGGEFVASPGPTVTGADVNTDIPMGVYGKGDAGAGGEFVNGTAYIYYNGKLIGSTGLTGTPYTVAGIPAGVTAGESYADRSGDNKLLVATESGGFDSKTFSGGNTSLYSTFFTLAITVTDADGNPVGGDRLVFDGSLEQTTGDDGTLAFQSSGTVDVTALNGTVEETVDLTGGGKSRTYQYAGVRGTVATPDGYPITGTTVALLDTDGNVLATTTTGPEGGYTFPTTGVNREGYVKADPWFRATETRGQGEYVTRSFPATILQYGAVGDSKQVSDDDLGDVRVEATDAPTGSPAAEVPVEVDGFRAATNPDGVARTVVRAGETYTVTVGSNDRYRQQQYEVAVDGSETLDVELERYQETSQA